MYEVIFKLCYNYRNRALLFHACVHALKSLIRPCSISDSVAALCTQRSYAQLAQHRDVAALLRGQKSCF